MTERNLFSAIFLFASGIVLYFGLPFTPVIQASILISILAAAVAIRYANRSIPIALTAVFLFGFFYADVRTGLVKTNLLNHSGWDREIVGVVERIDYTAANQRLFIRTADDLVLRISVPRGIECAEGADVSLRAKTIDAPGPANVFSRFDYRRWAYFNGISGTGFAYDAKCVGGKKTLRSSIHFMTDNRLADSLVLGYKGAIPRDEFDIIRASGVAHVFSISGFHLALVGGWLFFLFYAAARLITPFSRRWPARNLAVPFVLAGLLFYLLLSGSGIPTIRSFIMATAGFMALILGCSVLTLRNAALVFALMLLMQPFWAVSAGFQLSFAAIFGLLYFFNKHKLPKNKILRVIFVILMTDLVATAWTAPFAMYHFNLFPLYTSLGNLVLLPIFSLGIMPIIMFGTVTSLFGWRGPFYISDMLYDFVLGFSGWIQGLPFAQISIPEMPGVSLYLMFAGLFLFLMNHRRVALALIAIASIWIFARPVPVLRTTWDNEIVGFMQDGAMYFNVNWSERHRFIVPRGNQFRANCRRGLCVYKTENWTAVSVQRFVPLRRNLNQLCDYDFIISRLRLELPDCQEKVLPGGVRIYADGRVEKFRARRY